jgi:hypothetical protein
MFRRSAFLAAGGFRWPVDGAPFGEDYLLWLRLAALGSVAYIPEPLAAYRAHGDGLTGRLWDPLRRASLRHLADEIESAIRFADSAGVFKPGDLRTARRLLARHCLFAADACAFMDEHREYCLRKAWQLSSGRVALSTHFWRLLAKRLAGIEATEQWRRSKLAV